MKIVIVSSILPQTNYTRYLVEALQSYGKNDLDVFVYVDKNIKNLNNSLKNVKLVWSKSILYPFQILIQTCKDKPDVIHLQHEINMYGGPLTAALFPILVTMLRLTGKKVIVTIHAVVPIKQIDSQFVETFSWPHNRVFVIAVQFILYFIYRVTLIWSTKVVVHSNGIKLILISDYNARKEKIEVVPHGVPDFIDYDPEYVIKQKWFDKLKEKNIILCFGYIVKRKGLEYLIRAFETTADKHKNYSLVIAGGTLQKVYENYLKILVNNKKLSDRVIFTGFINVKDLDKLFRISDFVILPAIYSISASGPFALATYYHKPLITTDIGVFSEEIKNNVEGILCPAKDPVSLSNAMNELIENTEFRNILSNGMKKKHEVRRWSKIALHTYKIYLDSIGEYQ